MESASRIKSRFLVNLGTTFKLYLENIKTILFLSSGKNCSNCFLQFKNCH